MKRSIHFLLILLLCVYLLGCERDMPLPDPSEAPTPTMPVEEDVFYFSNDLEYSRLYRQREDGSGLELVVDDYCFYVQQHGDTVYYAVNNDLFAYHIPTGTHRSLMENALDYIIDGEEVVYVLDSDELFQMELWYRNLKTNENIFIDTVSYSITALKNGNIYYLESDEDHMHVILKKYDVSTGETTTLTAPVEHIYPMIADEEGVFFQSYDSNFDSHWYYAPADGSYVETVDYIPIVDIDVVHISKNGALCLQASHADERITQLSFRNTDGIRQILFESEPGANIYLNSLGNGRWMIHHQTDEPIGELNEYGYYDRYLHHVRNFLLHADGSVTELDTRGELASMFPDGDFPLLDSSTARNPVTNSLYDLFVANFGYEGQLPLCSTTHGAWLNIADRKVDLALLAAPTEEELAYLQQQGVEVDMKLYGGDGLVFIGNAANPVTNLTHEQITGIYRGKITNWKEVGGPDHPITVYYRDEQSGSQRLFEKLVFKGLEIPDFARMDFALMDDMSSIVDIILEDPYSIGYSIMTYLDEVYAEEDLQVFSVNGVLPSPDAVADGTYPYNTQGYLVIRSDEPEDSPARRLFNWFGCPVSDDLLTFNSVTPLSGGIG